MRITGDGVFRREADLIHASNCPEKMLAAVLSHFSPRSFCDIGCGTGVTLKWVHDHGVTDVWGVEGSKAAVEKSPLKDRITVHDLRQPLDLGRQFDVAYSFEVAEHLPEDAAAVFAASLTRHGSIIVLSAARPGQGGLGHLNEQPPEYWIEKLRSAGCTFDAAGTERLKRERDMYADNMLVFRRDTSA